MTSRYLAVFTIRPVQSFIVQARKFQDLVNGSAMLSELINEAINSIPSNFNSVMIFPRQYNRGSGGKDVSYPNVFLLTVALENPPEFGAYIKNTLCTSLSRKIKVIPKRFFSDEGRKLAERQISSLLEVDWAIVPLRGNEWDAHNTVRKLLASAKSVRRFAVGVTNGFGIMCSLCGQNLIVVKFGKGRTFNSHVKRITKFTPSEGTEGEGLCGICLLKRFWKEQSVESLASLSMADVARELRDIPGYEALSKNPSFDDQLLYPEYSDENLLRQYLGEEMEGMKESLGNLRGSIKDRNIPLKKYYALLLFDGDFMGRIMNGVDGQPGLFKMQMSVSEGLDKFTHEAQSLFQKPHRLIYAGGDDVLAALNLSDAMDRVDELRSKYPQKLGGHDNPTASAGMIIAHYKTNLHHVLNELRATEKLAKSYKNGNSMKDALAIKIISHSGSVIQCRFRWKYGDIRTVELINQIAREMGIDHYSPNFIYAMDDEFQFLDTVQNNDLPLIEGELRRLLSRSKSDKCKCNALDQIAGGCMEVLSGELGSGLSPLQTLISIFKVADFLARRVY